MSQVWFESYPNGVPHEIDVNTYSSVLDILDQAADKFKARPAYTNMGVTYSFQEVDRLSRHFAAFLQKKLNLKKGDRIALQMPNLLQYPIALFGALKAGLVVVNTNPLYTAQEMKHQFKDSGAKAIVISSTAAHLLQEIIGETEIEHVVVTHIGDMLGFPKKIVVNAAVKYIKKMVRSYSLPGAYEFSEALELGAGLTLAPVPLNHDDVAFLQYTGGTTGISKGAILTHKNVIANMLQIFAWMKPICKEGEEIVITPLPLYHIFSLTVNCMAFMAYGAHNILITNPRDLKAFLGELKKWKFTIKTGLNTLFNAMLNHPMLSEVDFSHCKLVVAGGMALQRPVAERWMKVTGSKVIEGYGLTETSPVVSCNPVDGTDQLGTIGLPLPSTSVKLMSDDGHEAAPGEAGELWVKGPQVMKAYWNQPEETQKVLTQDGWLKTGDIACINEKGFLSIVDRKKDMILVSGFNVYPNEVEQALTSHPNILEAAALGVPDEKSGEVVKVFVVTKSPMSAEDVIAHARKFLTSYKVPKIVEFRTDLPKTNVGKILRRALKEEAASAVNH